MNFWEERWRNGKTGWHGSTVNSNLIECLAGLGPLDNSKVLVPLCGKSLDVGWFADQGATVVGVDLVRQPLEEIFQERGSTHKDSVHNGLPKLSGGSITLFHSDIFTFTSDIDGTFDLIYDRAAMVALSPELREQYIEHCFELLKPNGQTLLITYDAPKADDHGPPFPVRSGTVEQLFSKYSEVTLLNTFTTTSENDPRLKEKNLEWVQTEVWLITK